MKHLAAYETTVAVTWNFRDVQSYSGMFSSQCRVSCVWYERRKEANIRYSKSVVTTLFSGLEMNAMCTCILDILTQMNNNK